MSETTLNHTEGLNETTERVLRRLHELYIENSDAKTDDERISEGMSSQIIGETTQKALQALIELETQRLQQQALREDWNRDALALEVGAMKQRLTADIFREHWFESTLSKADHPIHASTYGTSMFRYDLRMLMAENPSQERLDEFAWIMFDANGLRSFKDCTSHEETTHYLQGVVRILVNDNSLTRIHLKELGIQVIPMATGGDEFVLYLKGKQAISQSVIDQTVVSFQNEISASEELRSFLNFDNEGVQKQFGMPSSAQRKAFDLMTDHDQEAKLRDIREKQLPEVFIPSFSGGGALLTDGILRAVEKDDDDLEGSDETFHSLREKVVQATIELAEARQKKNKEDELRKLEKTNPRMHAFRMRNQENRLLLEQKAALERELETTRGQLQQLLGSDQTGEA